MNRLFAGQPGAPAAQPPSKPVRLWWLSPVALICAFVLPFYFLITLIGLVDSPGLTIRSARFISGGYLLLGAAMLVALALGGWVGQQINDKRPITPVSALNWRPALWVVGLIVLATYLYWFREILFSPATLLGVMTGSVVMSRQQIGGEAGVTSLVNFGPIFFALYAHVWMRERCSIGPALKGLAGAILVLTVLRVYVWGERLALIEVLACGFVPAIYGYIQKSPQAMVSRAGLAGPYLALPLLVLYFGFWEYFRSWQASEYFGTMSYAEFFVGRFATYYYTSLNNGAGLLSMYDWPTYKFEFTAEWAHKAPFLVGAIFRYIVQMREAQLGDFLRSYADVEFNNPSGIFTVVYDMGVGLGFLYFFAIGALSGALYRSFVSGRLGGVLLYPMMLIVLAEVFRYPYLGSTRAFTAALGAALALVALHWRVGSSRLLARRSRLGISL